MHLEPKIALKKGLLRGSKYLLGLVVILAIGVSLGWFLNIGFLLRPLWGLPPMGPASSLAFICSTFSVILLSPLVGTTAKIKIISGRILVFTVLFIAGLELMQVISGSTFDLDPFIFSGKRISENLENLNFRMPSISAFCFLLSSFSILLLNFETASRKMPGQALAMISGGIGLLSLFGYLFQIKAFYGVWSYDSMSLEASVCFLLISLAILNVHPGKGFMRKFSNPSSNHFGASSLILFA